MTFRTDVRHLLRTERNLSGKQILERLGRTGKPNEWKVIEEEQVQLRGNRPARRKNKSKGSLNSWRGPYIQGKSHITRFIPPEKK